MRLFSRNNLFYNLPKGWSVARHSIVEPYIHNYSSIAYGNGKFVAINEDGYVLTSPDTLTWTLETLRTGGENCNKIIYDGSRFVVLTSYGNIKTSSNAASWSSEPDIGWYNAWCDLVYDGNNYIAINATGHVCTSSDLTSWSTPKIIDSRLPITWSKLAFDDEKIIAFGSERYTSISTDSGKHWSTPSITYNIDSPNAVIYADKFIAIVLNYTVRESSDGTTWENLGTNINLDNAVAGNWVSITKNNNILAALSDNGYISTKRI